MYCARCSRLVYQAQCPGCGRRDLRLPGSEDFCFLAEPEPLWVRAMEDLLAEEGIEFVTRNLYGAGQVKMTGLPERVRFFVRYRDYTRAKELEEAFFSASFEFDTE